MSDHKPTIPVVVIAIANERSEEGFLRNLTEEMKLIMNLLEEARQNGRCGVRILPCATKEDIINVFQDEWFPRPNLALPLCRTCRGRGIVGRR